MGEGGIATLWGFLKQFGPLRISLALFSAVSMHHFGLSGSLGLHAFELVDSTFFGAIAYDFSTSIILAGLFVYLIDLALLAIGGIISVTFFVVGVKKTSTTLWFFKLPPGWAQIVGIVTIFMQLYFGVEFGLTLVLFAFWILVGALVGRIITFLREWRTSRLPVDFRSDEVISWDIEVEKIRDRLIVMICVTAVTGGSYLLGVYKSRQMIDHAFKVEIIFNDRRELRTSLVSHTSDFLICKDEADEIFLVSMATVSELRLD